MLFCPVYGGTPGDLRNTRSVLLAYNQIASLPSYCPAISLLFHVPRDGALGQGWQTGIIILALASAHALPLIHFTASLAAPEGEMDHVGEKESPIKTEVSSSVILPFPTSSFTFSLRNHPHLLLPHGLPNCMMPFGGLLLVQKEAERDKELGCFKVSG